MQLCGDPVRQRTCKRNGASAAAGTDAAAAATLAGGVACVAANQRSAGRRQAPAPLPRPQMTSAYLGDICSRISPFGNCALCTLIYNLPAL